MVIISKAIIREFTAIHADSEGPLNNWYELMANADWKNDVLFLKALYRKLHLDPKVILDYV